MHRLLRLLAMIAVLIQAAPALADDAVLNKEGFWTVGRGDGGPRCFASIPTKSGDMFILQAEAGDVTFGVGTKRRLRGGRKGELSTEAYSFEFTPAFSDRGDMVRLDDPMNERALAALRLARGLMVRVDGREVFNADVEGTGLEGALDAVVACSNGKNGWWGPGARVAQSEEKAPEGVLNEEGFWTVQANPEEDSCTAYAQVNRRLYMVLVGVDDGISFGVSTDRTLTKGRKGTFETEAYSFGFEPSYDDNYLYFDDAMSSRSLAALRLARSLRISVDGRTIASMKLEGTGVDGVLDALAECAAGRDGWWGKGLKSAKADDTGESRAGGSGTGFFISTDGVAVTAAHVVADCRSVESPRWGAVKVLASDPRADLAILKTTTASGQALPLRGRGPKLGEQVTAGGYPLGGLLGSGLKITTGVVSGLSGPEGDRGLFQISAPIQPGNSGGPVVDAGGALVGVAAAKLDEVTLVRATGEFPQNVNFAVPVTVLQAFLEENGVAYRTASAAGPAVGAPALTGVAFSLICKP